MTIEQVKEENARLRDALYAMYCALVYEAQSTDGLDDCWLIPYAKTKCALNYAFNGSEFDNAALVALGKESAGESTTEGETR